MRLLNFLLILASILFVSASFLIIFVSEFFSNEDSKPIAFLSENRNSAETNPMNPLTYNNSFFNHSQTQFYKNMRFPERRISYYFDLNCNSEKREYVKKAFEILSNYTILEFFETNNFNNKGILILCSQLIVDEKDKEYFIAGEGGPVEIINSTFPIIISSKISLYRDERCKTPQIALHEILHALGFDHSDNPQDIMYPYSSCEQQISKELISEINRIYSIPSLPDIFIDEIEGNKTGNYLNFKIIIGNGGFKDLNTAILEVYADSTLLRKFQLNNLSLGSKKVLSISNLRMNKNSNEISFLIKTDEKEISLDNNLIKLKIE